MGQPPLPHCGAVCEGGVGEGTMPLAWLLPCFQDTSSFSHHNNPHRFLQPEVLRLYFACTVTLDYAVCLTPQLFLPVYLHKNMGPPIPQVTPWPGLLAAALPAPALQPPLCLLPVWMNVSSLTPWLSDFHSVRFFCQFWRVFVFKFVVLLVVRGGTVCLPK